MPQWYVSRDGGKNGPYEEDVLKQMAQAGQVAPTDMVWTEGLEDWVVATKLKGVFMSTRVSASFHRSVSWKGGRSSNSALLAYAP